MHECLEWALNTNQDAGAWGDKTEDERRALRRAQGAKAHGSVMRFGVVSVLFEALEDLAAGLEGVAGRLADWAHGLHCDTCRREQA